MNNIFLEHENIKLWAYLNIDNPVVAWEVAIGRIRSSCDINEFAVSSWFYNHIRSKKSFFFKKEQQLERIRENFYPNAISRFKGLYFFKSKDDAINAHKTMNLKINQDYLTQVNFSANKYSEHDSMYITDKLSSGNNNDWMKKYWQGATLYEKPLIEVLASGIGVVTNNKLRERAYWKIVNDNLYSQQLLNYFIADFSINEHESTGQVLYTLKKENKKLSGKILLNDFYMKKVKGNPLKKFFDKGYSLPQPKEKKYYETIKIPDINKLFFEKDL